MSRSMPKGKAQYSKRNEAEEAHQKPIHKITYDGQRDGHNV